MEYKLRGFMDFIIDKENIAKMEHNKSIIELKKDLEKNKYRYKSRYSIKKII